jgi:streptogramin lyase
MRSANSLARLALIALCLTLFASVCFAANPLNQPAALAVDSAGNLWIANQGTNSILAFDSTYTQLTTRTITKGISAPDGLAFDSLGNLWVANFSASNGGSKGSVSVYKNGVQVTAGAIIDGIADPIAIAVDPLGTVWITNQNHGVNVYANVATKYGVEVSLVKTLALANPVYGVAFSNGSLLWGTTSETNIVGAEAALLYGDAGVTILDSKTGISMAAAANGVVYIGNLDGSVSVYKPSTKRESQFVQLSVVTPGIAVDNARGRVYISQSETNQILVYSTAGELLHTID